MKRWLTNTIIAGYLGALLVGLVSHAVVYRTNSHPLMYFLVWDMYCGWSAFETRLHALGETYDGKYYELLPAPWGEFHPYGGPARRHYDVHVRFVPQMAELVLAHTEHEPIRRIIVVEEAWSKKYNLPDPLWAQRYAEPKQRYSYFHVRAVTAPDGGMISRFTPWTAALANQAIMDNPRLMSDVAKGHAFFAVDPPAVPADSGVIPTSYTTFAPGAH